MWVLHPTLPRSGGSLLRVEDQVGNKGWLARNECDVVCILGRVTDIDLLGHPNCFFLRAGEAGVVTPMDVVPPPRPDLSEAMVMVSRWHITCHDG